MVVDHVLKIHSFQKMWSLIVIFLHFPSPQFFPPIFQCYCNSDSGFHPQTNKQSEQANQDLEQMFAVWHPTIRLPEDISSPGQSMPPIRSLWQPLMPPFSNSVGHQPHLFASQEPGTHVPFTQTFVQWCRLKRERVSKVLFQAGNMTWLIPSMSVGRGYGFFILWTCPLRCWHASWNTSS